MAVRRLETAAAWRRKRKFLFSVGAVSLYKTLFLPQERLSVSLFPNSIGTIENS